ncbi:imelysin family protein [Marinagarivorans algicola]|uniref:imelysin family protein n=1 Tax=Marinagarivorans algicola TaxID=1513270 RepID=UPI0006B95E4F|nr:imelysin family protein [Marinagarivorans algicola]
MKIILKKNTLIVLFSATCVLGGCKSSSEASMQKTSSSVNEATNTHDTTNANTTASSQASSSQSNDGAHNNFNQHQFKQSTIKKLNKHYHQFYQSNQVLHREATAFCSQVQTPKDSTLLKAAWFNSNKIWQYLQAITFGPIAENSRRYDIAYYPITKSTLETKIHELVEIDEKPLTVQYIAEQPASRQGITALEYLLFRDDAVRFFSEDAIGQRYCDYVQAISQRLIDLSYPVDLEWQQGGLYYTTVMSELSTNAFNEAIFGAINERLSIISNDKITKVQAGNTSEIESAYAHISLSNIKENIAFIRDIYETPFEQSAATPSQGILAWLSSEGHQDVALEMHQRLSALEAVLDTLGQSLIQTLEDSHADENITALLNALHNVHEYHARSVAQSLNIFIGFSGADGD